MSHLFATTWAPTANSLKEEGFKVHWLGRDPVIGFSSYGALDSNKIPVDYIHHHTFLGNLLFMSYFGKKSDLDPKKFLGYSNLIQHLFR